MGRAALTAALVVPGILVAAGSPASAAGATVYVAEGGSNSSDCSSVAAPCATVSYALTKVGAAATVKVAGTIHDNITVPWQLSGLTITGADAPTGSPAVIDGSGAGQVVYSTATLTLDHLTIRNGNGGNGGGILTDGDLTLTHTTVSGNTANTGGGIYNWYGTLTIVDSTITGNTATGLGGAGGIYTGFAAVTLTRSTVSNNVASGGSGGGIAQYSGSGNSFLISDSTISGNQSSQGGGFIGDAFTVVNSTISGNSATFGGAFWNTVGTIDVTASTIAGNTGSQAILNNYGTVNLGGSILGPNSGATCGGNAPVYVSRGYNLDSDGSCGLAGTGDVKNVDPQLGALADNGGPTRTMRPALAGPAVDRIPVGATAGGVTLCGRYDQRGVPGPVASMTGCTIGAVEPADWVLTAQAPLSVTSTSGTVGTPVALTTSGGTGNGAVTFAASNGTASGCAVSPSAPYTLTATSSGTCLVTATKAAWGIYQEASSSPTAVTFAKLPQSPLAVTSLGGEVGTPLALTASGGSGTGAVTFAASDGTASGCEVSPSAPYTLSATTAGSCLVTATRAGDSTYLPVSSSAATVTLAALAQAPLTVTSTAGTFGEPLLLATAGGSGAGDVTYDVQDGSVTCTLSPSAPYTLSAAGPGTCFVRATRAGDGVYAAVSSELTEVTFARLTQDALSVTSTGGTVGKPLTLTTAGGSGSGAVSFAAEDGTATGCTVSSFEPYTLTASTAGTCVVTATKAADDVYAEGSSGPTTVTMAAAPVVLKAPGAVRSLTVGGRPAALFRVVSWQKPASSGGTPVTGYKVVVKKGARTVLTKTPTGTRVTLRRATLPVGYLKVFVRARNAVGFGPAASKAFTVRK